MNYYAPGRSAPKLGQATSRGGAQGFSEQDGPRRSHSKNWRALHYWPDGSDVQLLALVVHRNLVAEQLFLGSRNAGMRDGYIELGAPATYPSFEGKIP